VDKGAANFNSMVTAAALLMQQLPIMEVPMVNLALVCCLSKSILQLQAKKNGEHWQKNTPAAASVAAKVWWH